MTTLIEDLYRTLKPEDRTMPTYCIMIDTKEEETISSLARAVEDSVMDFGPGAIDPGFLPIDTAREGEDTDGFQVTFQRTD